MRIGLIKMRVYNKERNPVAEPPKKKFEAMDKAKVVFDDDNPEWTAEDFKHAKYGDDMPDFIKKAFPRKHLQGKR